MLVTWACTSPPPPTAPALLRTLALSHHVASGLGPAAAFLQISAFFPTLPPLARIPGEDQELPKRWRREASTQLPANSSPSGPIGNREFPPHLSSYFLHSNLGPNIPVSKELQMLAYRKSAGVTQRVGHHLWREGIGFPASGGERSS